jgi:hypothetical protein
MYFPVTKGGSAADARPYSDRLDRKQRDDTTSDPSTA